MTLNALKNIDFEKSGANDFAWFAHFQDHIEIVQALQKKFNTNLTIYLIFPFSKDNFDTIMLAHQQYHDDFNGLLGLEGTDLQNIEIGDKFAESTWTNQNFYEHYAARQALEI